MIRRKGILTVFMTAFMVVAFAGMAFAAQNISLKTTVPDVPKSECYQVGTQTMEMDNGTVLTAGDVMRFSLSNNTSLCKSFDFYLRMHDGLVAADAALPGSTSADPVTATNPGAAGMTWTATGAGFGAAVSDYGFHVKGVAGSQNYTMTVARRDKVTGVLDYGNLPANYFMLTYTESVVGSKLIVKFFDKKFLTPYFWKQNATAGAYLNDSGVPVTGTPFVAELNILCANTSSALFTAEYLESTGNSIPNLTAVPPGSPVVFSGDYRVAHIVDAIAVNPYACKGDNAGHIIYPTTQAACMAFDFEGLGVPANGYCTDHTPSQFIVQSTYPFEVTTYTVTAEILVNGVQGERGVYFSNLAPTAATYTTAALACAGAGPVALPGLAWLKADSSTAVPVAPIAACDAVAAAAKAVKFTTTAGNLGIIASDKYYLYIDLPTFNWNLSDIHLGDGVSVRITVSKATCGVVGTYTVTVGTFGCGAAAALTNFPYFTSLTVDPTWWNGIAIVNSGSTAGTANLTAYEKDGSQATASIPIAANSMFVDMVDNITWTPTGGAVLGGSPCYISVSCDFPPLGFGMIANPVTGESMGYLSKP